MPHVKQYLRPGGLGPIRLPPPPHVHLRHQLQVQVFTCASNSYRLEVPTTLLDLINLLEQVTRLLETFYLLDSLFFN